MDPNANLRAQAQTNNSTYLRELRHALADWLGSGGFEPDWHAYPQTAKRFKTWAKRYYPYQ
jgi:hypothetical protein